MPFEALEARNTVASGTPDPIRTMPVIDRIFAQSAATRMGARMINIDAGEVEYPVTTSSVTAGWQATETGDVAGPTAYAVTDKPLTPAHTLGITMTLTRRTLKQSGAALEQAVRRDMNGTIAQELDKAIFLGSGASGQPDGVIADAGDYGITSTAIAAAPTWASFRAAVVRFMAANAISAPGDVRVLIRPEVWDDLEGTIFDTGSGLTEWDRMTRSIAANNVVVSSNALAAPTGDPLATSALLTCSPGGVEPVFVGMWGGVDLIRDPYTAAASGALKITALVTADLTVSRPAQTPETETRAASGFTAEVIQAREAFVSGRRGIAELTATAQSCVSMWEHALSFADVDGAPMLDRLTLALMGRALVLRGEAVFLIDGAELVAASDWELRTRNGKPRAYRLTIPDAGGGRSFTALADEVLHVRIGCDPAAPYYGTAPLRRSSLTAGLLNAVEAGLSEVYANAPLGSQIVPLPDSDPADMYKMRDAFRGRRGAVLVIEGVAQATAAGMNPQLGQRREELTPDLTKSLSVEALGAAREAVSFAFGVLPAMHNRAATGPVIREAQRHLATWTLAPVAGLIAEEASRKLGGPVKLDVMRPLQAFDAGGRARAASAVVAALAAAKEAGIDPALALHLVDWKADE